MSTLAHDSIPGPRVMPVFGIRGNYLRFFRDPITVMRSFYETYGEVVAFTQNDPSWIFAFGPEYNRLVLSNTDTFYSSLFILPVPEASALHRLLSGLLSMNGDQHRQHRRLIVPAFHKGQVEQYYDDMVAIIQHALDGWSVHERIDVAQKMREVTLGIAMKTLFGVEDTQAIRRLGSLLQEFLTLLTSDLVNQFPFNMPFLPYRRLLALAEELESRIKDLVAQKRAHVSAYSDILAHLIQAHDEQGDRITDADLIGHVNLLFLAGHETSANALTWTLFLLAQHPHIANDVLDELDVLQGAAPTIEKLPSLSLLERVMKESMRLFPPAAMLGRYSTGEFHLGPYTFSKRASVTISPYITHHMPDMYPRPERFDPDRWLSLKPSPYEYLPFGAGSRKCVGETFAMQEMKIALASILQRYRLTIIPNAQIDAHLRLTLAPRQGMPMLVAPQDRAFERTPIHGTVRDLVELE